MNSKYRKFVSYYKPYKGLFFGDMACAVVVAVASLAYPLCIRYVTGSVLGMEPADAAMRIFTVGGIMLAILAVQSVCLYFVDARGHAMGAMMESDMRMELFDQYQRLTFRFYDGQKTGQLLSRITHDLLSLTELYHHGPEDLVIHSVKFIGASVVLWMVSPQISLAVFALLPPMAVFAVFMSRRLRAMFRRNRERIADVNTQVEDTLAGIRVVQSFSNESIEREKFHAANKNFLFARTDTYRNEAYYTLGMHVFSQLILVAVVVAGGIGLTGRTLGMTDLITFLLYVGYLIEPIPRLAHIIQQYQEGFAGFDRFMEIMNLAPEIADAPDAVNLGRARGEVAFEDVGFRYGERTEFVLKNVNLTVRPGEYVALVGASGVGKTTLCSLIPRFYDVSCGRVLVDGTDIRKISLDSLRRNIGVVQQDVYLFSGTVAENIRYGKPGASDGEIAEAARKAGAHEFIMALPDGYDTDIGQRGVRLSGGQKQRLSIARVFLKDPPILIFDEATSALDSESERAVQESLEKLAQRRTTFVIAHRLSTIRNAHRALVLTEGGIREEEPRNLLAGEEGEK